MREEVLSVAPGAVIETVQAPERGALGVTVKVVGLPVTPVVLPESVKEVAGDVPWCVWE